MNATQPEGAFPVSDANGQVFCTTINCVSVVGAKLSARFTVLPVAVKPFEFTGTSAPVEQEAPHVDLDQVADAWQRSIVEAVRERSIPVASLLEEATPTELAGDTLTLEFPAGADFHRKQVAEPGNIGLLRDALYEVTGRKLAVVLETGHEAAAVEDDEPMAEDDFVSLLKETLDAEEVSEP